VGRKHWRTDKFSKSLQSSQKIDRPVYTGVDRRFLQLWPVVVAHCSVVVQQGPPRIRRRDLVPGLVGYIHVRVGPSSVRRKCSLIPPGTAVRIHTRVGRGCSLVVINLRWESRMDVLVHLAGRDTGLPTIVHSAIILGLRSGQDRGIADCGECPGCASIATAEDVGDNSGCYEQDSGERYTNGNANGSLVGVPHDNGRSGCCGNTFGRE